MDPIFLTFIKNLPPKEQTFYLLIRAYEKELHTVTDQRSLTLISDIYEARINDVLRRKMSPTTKEESKDPFEDKLGTWASDFSETEIEQMLSLEEK